MTVRTERLPVGRGGTHTPRERFLGAARKQLSHFQPPALPGDCSTRTFAFNLVWQISADWWFDPTAEPWAATRGSPRLRRGIAARVAPHSIWYGKSVRIGGSIPRQSRGLQPAAAPGSAGGLQHAYLRVQSGMANQCGLVVRSHGRAVGCNLASGTVAEAILDPFLTRPAHRTLFELLSFDRR